MTSQIEAAEAKQATTRKTPWAWATGTFFGIGLIGKGGGTVASIATVAIWLTIARLQLSSSALIGFTVVAALTSIFIGIPAGTIIARELGKKDPSQVVIDEVAGQLIALIGAPLNWKYVLASLILFRGFDIVKPPPVRQLENLPDGTGIMMDDVAAGFYALIFVQLLYRFNLFN
ncbi:MAG: phosphatidylglycerophosphatase [Acidobacteriaceae bacterium]|nr:phosphatidylglycerophosphatase [Acidobacteriaceae bacterium]